MSTKQDSEPVRGPEPGPAREVAIAPVTAAEPSPAGEPPAVAPAGGLQGWIERNRARIWIWGIAGMALLGIGGMMLIIVLIIVTR